MPTDQDDQIAGVVERERGRLWSFIRRRVLDESDAEDILQEVFFELVEAYRLMKPVEQVGAWLFQVARRRIIDRFRHKQPASLHSVTVAQDGHVRLLEELLPAAGAGPDVAYARRVIAEQLDLALEELPAAQRDVFVAHELEGRSFREMADRTGTNMNTLLARKRYAVLHLRRRLERIYDELR
jgi:RNA polymerase sigma factor (sigma-70 family)